MRYGPLALMLALIPSTASAQTPVVALQQRLSAAPQVSPEMVVTRLMSFDRNQDGKVSADELSERMQAVVARADRSGDGALDAAEIRAAAAAPAARKAGVGGSYTFGDMSGVPLRTRIADAIDDLRLPAGLGEQARHIGDTYAGEVEAAALARLRAAVAPMLTEAQLAQFEASATAPRSTGVMVTRRDSTGTTAQEVVIASTMPLLQLSRLGLAPDQQKVAMAAITAFNAQRQFDDARRSALMARFDGVLSEGEREDLDAALARRPLVKNTPATSSGFVVDSIVRVLH